MSSETLRPQGSPAADESEVGALYRELLDCWNRRDAHDFAALFQNTPAQFHGRPDVAQELTEELGGVASWKIDR